MNLSAHEDLFFLHENLMDCFRVHTWVPVEYQGVSSVFLAAELAAARCLSSVCRFLPAASSDLELMPAALKQTHDNLVHPHWGGNTCKTICYFSLCLSLGSKIVKIISWISLLNQCHTHAFVLTCFLPREQGVRFKILHDLLAVLWVKLFKSCCQAGRQTEDMTINKMNKTSFLHQI